MLVPGGRFLFYVYNRKGPVREFTDDYIRDALQGMGQSEAWDALLPLSKLGRSLGALDVTLEIEEPIELLGVPAGPISLQRFFYWHVCKTYFDPELTLDEMNHINFDWFAPTNAHRQTPEQVREWCARPAWRSSASAWRRRASRSSPAASDDSLRGRADGRR